MEYKISKTIYNENTLLKVIYNWQECFDIVVSEDAYNYILSINPKLDNTAFEQNKFNKELEEQQLREDLDKQFGKLRDAIYAKAFKNF